LPVALKQLALEIGELAARRAHQIIGAALPKLLQIILANHPAIKHPHPALHPVFTLDLIDDLLESGYVRGVSVENLVGHREAFRSDYQSDDDLQSIWTVITGVTARGALHLLGFSFKIGAR
jgi:hypothetical protein